MMREKEKARMTWNFPYYSKNQTEKEYVWKQKEKENIQNET